MLLLVVLLTALCGIIYELLLSAISSYLIWNSIVQFSITIWFFLFGLGLWSHISKYIKNLEKSFLYVEIILALLGAFSVLTIKWVYIWLINYELIFQIFYILLVVSIWTLVWLEIPIIASILDKKNKNIQTTVWDVFSWDYIWSLIWTLLFPFILIPWLGLTYTAFAVWILNLIIAFSFLVYIKSQDKNFPFWLKEIIVIWLSFLIIIIGWLYSKDRLETLWDHFFYKEPILYSKHSQYQKIVITKRWNDIRLYLNGHLQFLSLDENRYHTSLTYFPKKLIDNFSWNKLDILILWWGDGLATRNLINYLSWKNFKWNITLVDLDPQITYLAQTHPILLKLNKWSLNNKNVKILNQDAFNCLRKNKQKYNIIIADFPDPRNIEISKLYSKEFYAMISNHLKEKWVFTTQSSSAFFSKEAFWCIYKTMKSLVKTNNIKVIPYHSYIPSFWDWWFVSYIKNINFDKQIIALSGLVQFNFDKDYQVNLQKIKENTLENPNIINYYILGRKRYSQ
jgi:spermidine synthase